MAHLQVTSPLLFLLLGLVLLFSGGEGLVRGSAALALRLGLTPLVVGLTVVAFGTSAPELVVSVKAAHDGQGAIAIAIANVIGSNILNIGSLGTSMPELVTCVVAALKRAPDIDLGNIIGSNIFNVLGILGAAALTQPMVGTGIKMADLYVAIAFAVVLVPILWSGRRLERWEGALLLVAYAGYLAWLWPK